MVNLSGKTVLVTGGNTGIGKEIVTMFAQAKAHVVVNYLYQEKEAEELRDSLENITLLKGDVSKMDDVDSMVLKLKELGLSIDVLVNNAGITRDNLMLRMSEKEFDDVINVNLKGTWAMSKGLTKAFLKKRSGSIINIASVVGLLGNAGQANYVASKAGIIGLTKSLAKEFGSRGVRVNAIAPGFIQTKMTDDLPETVKESYLSTIPLGRFGNAKDIAALALFLASDDAAYITGQVISVNGGMV
ncbi:MAG: 3-oxoacyl-[acyl-carrier-protein] reductase [Candidatus Izemoplasmataceae bacterium]